MPALRLRVYVIVSSYWLGICERAPSDLQRRDCPFRGASCIYPVGAKIGFTLGSPREREKWRSEPPANRMSWIGVVGAERSGTNRRGEVVAEGHIVLRDSLDRRLD